MRLLSVGLLLATGALLCAQPDDDMLSKRFGVALKLDRLPQDTPQATLASITKVLDDRKTTYLLAHLADPAYVNGKVREYKEQYARGPEAARELLAFEKLVEEIEAHFKRDPSLVRDLYRFAKEGEWEVAEDTATAKVAALLARKVYFKKIDKRWYLENRQQ